jgi:hypothetical protein
MSTSQHWLEKSSMTTIEAKASNVLRPHIAGVGGPDRGQPTLRINVQRTPRASRPSASSFSHKLVHSSSCNNQISRIPACNVRKFNRKRRATAAEEVMASPMVDGRVEPHRKATYTLDVSDQIRREERSGSGFSGVKCMHTLFHPPQPMPMSACRPRDAQASLAHDAAH